MDLISAFIVFMLAKSDFKLVKIHVPDQQAIIACQTEGQISVLMHMWKHHGLEDLRLAYHWYVESSPDPQNTDCLIRQHLSVVAATDFGSTQLLPVEDGWKMRMYRGHIKTLGGAEYYTLSQLPVEVNTAVLHFNLGQLE